MFQVESIKIGTFHAKLRRGSSRLPIQQHLLSLSGHQDNLVDSNITGQEPGAGPLLLFNAETPTPTQSSIAFCRILGPTSGDNGITFHVLFSSAPTSATVLVQAAEVEDDTHYGTVTTMTFTSPQTYQFYTDIGRSKFYRVQLSAISGAQAMTVYAQR